MAVGEDTRALVVYGPGSDRYDFGLLHPLTPRRFGPGIGLLRAYGADRFLAPEPASDAELYVPSVAYARLAVGPVAL